ncbi:MAG: glycerol-3-phosphate dehydrogenase [Oscillospiraceae bacterium]|nr:glycerol-3-phosphate dehydrogenase [Oscillospiraceae bacterium]
MHVGILGSGRWATFLAWYTRQLGHAVTLWGRTQSERFRQLQTSRRNATVTLQNDIALVDNLTVVSNCDYLLIAVAAQSLRDVLNECQIQKLQIPIVLCMKGLETKSGLRLSQVATQCLDENYPTAVWLGPGHPQDFAAGIPNCMVIDSQHDALRRDAADAFSSPLIRIYYGNDLIGNEIGAAAKNVVGIAAGMLDGSGRSSLKGALMARGAYEISQLTAKLGGDIRSTYGLCHLGDYEATLFSPHSQNRLYGEQFIQGKPSQKLAEGYHSVPAFIELAQQQQIELPICQAVYDIIYKHADTAVVLERLFARETRYEFI